MINEMMNKWLVQLSLVCLTACATGAQSNAQSVPQGVRGSGPPTVTITQVTELSNAGWERRIQAQWTAQKPELTTILKYAVTLEVKFTGGVTQTASQKLGATVIIYPGLLRLYFNAIKSCARTSISTRPTLKGETT